jgi:AAA+ ATPase superfamily predicted ATPase
MFINRQTELEFLQQMYESDHAELFVVYGRRRVGKTELLRAFCERKAHIFFIATLSADGEQLSNFSQQIWAFTHSETPPGFSFPSWEAAFRALADLPGRPIVILDEFTYLISGNKAIPSILQKVWDEKIKNTRVMLVLCGSYIGMMETEALGHQSPLYGRRTHSLLLEPLDLPASTLFFPNYSYEDKFLAWAILGGLPYYLRIFSDQVDIFTNIRKHIMDAKSAELFSEPRLLLMEELREPRNYFSILRAIAQGNTRLNEIALSSGVGSVNTVARYVDILQQMRLITRQTPATEFQPKKSKRGVYQVDDHFLRFWFRYVQPYQGSLDLGLTDAIIEQRIRPNLDSFVALAFKKAARDWVANLARNGKLEFIPERIGGWWKRDVEIDVVAISRAENHALVGECKWSSKPVGLNILEELKQKAPTLAKDANLTKINYCLFSRSGFTPALEKQAQKDEIMLFGVEALVR